MPSLPWPTTTAELRMFVRPPRNSGRPVSGGLPFRGRLFLSVNATGGNVVGISYNNGSATGSAPVQYTSNQSQVGQIGAFNITAGSDIWSFNSAFLINSGSGYFFLSQSMTINGVAFTVAGIGDVVGNRFGSPLSVTMLGTVIGSLSLSPTTVTFLPGGSQQPIPVTVGTDLSLTWTSSGTNFTGYPTLLGINRAVGANPLSGGYVGIASGAALGDPPDVEVDWEASSRGPVGDEPTPPAYPVPEE